MSYSGGLVFVNEKHKRSPVETVSVYDSEYLDITSPFSEDINLFQEIFKLCYDLPRLRLGRTDWLTECTVEARRLICCEAWCDIYVNPTGTDWKLCKGAIGPFVRIVTASFRGQAWTRQDTLTLWRLRQCWMRRVCCALHRLIDNDDPWRSCIVFSYRALLPLQTDVRYLSMLCVYLLRHAK